MKKKKLSILKNLRKKKGLSQAQVAEIIGITYQAYAHYETGRRKVNIDYLIPLSELLDVDLKELIIKLTLFN